MDEAILKIYGDIGESNAMDLMMEMGESISAKTVSDFLDENKKAKSILVKINSRGGDVQEGWTIYDLLKNSGKTIRTLGEGKIYSIATIIFLAGTEREIMENADGQIHNPYIPEYTLADSYEADDLEKISEALRQEEEKILDFYVEKTGTDKDKLANYMKEDTKLSAEDMVELGFATKILEPIKAFAYIKSQNKFHMDAKEFKTFGEKLDTLISKVVGLSRVEPTNLTLKDKDGNEFTLEKEEGSPTVGDKATPDGTFVMEDGKTIIIADGAISEINDAEVDSEDLDKANAKIVQLEADILKMKEDAPDLKAKEEAIATKEADLATKETEMAALVTGLKALKNDWNPEGRTRQSSAAKAGEVDLSQVKEIMNKKKELKPE